MLNINQKHKKKLNNFMKQKLNRNEKREQKTKT